MASEKNYENKIKKFLQERGHWFIKYWAGSQYTKSGIPDLLCCVNGYFLAIEVKGKGGRVSPLQRHQIQQIIKAGGDAMVSYPEDWEDLKAFILFLEGSKVT